MSKTGRALVTLTALVFVALSAVNVQAEKTKLTLWSVHQGRDYLELAEQFESQNPDIDVEVVFVPYGQFLTDATAAFRANRAPDVVTMIQAWAPQFIESGYLLPLDEYIDKDLDTEAYFDFTWRSFIRDGKTYAAPFMLGVEAMYYNKELLLLGGFSNPPATWDEFLKWGEALKKHGKYVYGLTAGSPVGLSYRFLPWLYSAGGAVVNDAWTEATMDTPEAIKALEFETNLLKKYQYAPPSGPTDGTSDVYLMFVNGQVATMIRGPQDMFAIYRDHRDFFEKNLLIGPMPGVEPGKPGMTVSYAYALAISSRTRNPEAAWKLVKFLSEPENMARITIGDLPARKDAMAYPGPELAGGQSFPYTHELYSAFLKQLEATTIIPNHPMWPEIEKVIHTYYQRVLGGRTDAATAGADMTKEIQQLLDRYQARRR